LLRQYQILIDSNFFLRDAINTPPNQKYPELFAQKVQKECAPFYSVEILSGSELEKF
jgi:leucyl aminopeptidase